MRGIIAVAVIALLGGCSGGNGVPLAEASVVRFHSMLDAGKFAQVYHDSAAEMRSASPEQTLTDLLSAVHRKLGRFQSANTTGWRESYTTGGHFVTLIQAAKYERGEAQEQFLVKISGDQGALAGYHVNSNALIIN